MTRSRATPTWAERFEQSAQFGLDTEVPLGKCVSVAERPGREQQVRTGGIHRDLPATRSVRRMSPALELGVALLHEHCDAFGEVAGAQQREELQEDVVDVLFERLGFGGAIIRLIARTASGALAAISFASVVVRSTNSPLNESSPPPRLPRPPFGPAMWACRSSPAQNARPRTGRHDAAHVVTGTASSHTSAGQSTCQSAGRIVHGAET